MPSDRIERCFADCAVLVRNTVSPDECIGKRYVALEHIEEGTLRLLGIGDGSEVTSAKSEFHAGDILFGKLRPYFRKVIRPRFDGVCSTDIWVVRAVDGIDQGFLYYWMASKDFVEAATRGSTGTKMPRADWEFVGRLTLPVPSPDTQRRIAAILGSLDDKIELNRRMNRTLEKMAAAIFKSWFIDFDPVHAKAEGRAPNLPAEIAALFPDTFEDSDLGPIPKGWDIKTLAEAVTLTGGGTPKKSIAEYWGGSIPWFSVVDAPSPSDVFVIDTRDHITEAGLAGSSTRLLPLGTTIISARGTVGKCALVGTPMAMNQSCYGVRGHHPDTDIFTYYLLQQHVGTLSRSGHGSVFNTITRATFDSIDIIATPPILASSFDENVAPLMNRILANNKASQTLAALRDILLPKLLSGEIELPEAEAIAEEAS